MILIASGINGFGAAILWVGQGKYIADCATDENRGFFYGYFWAWFMSTQVLGNLIGALVIDKASQSVYYIVMASFAFLGWFAFFLLKKPIVVAK